MLYFLFVSLGLTVTLSRDSGTGDYALEAGALVLADQGKGLFKSASALVVLVYTVMYILVCFSGLYSNNFDSRQHSFLLGP